MSMNKLLLIGTLAGMMLAGFTFRSIPQKLDKFTKEAEEKSESYTSRDWEKSISEYDALTEEYFSSKKNYSPEERQMATRAMGRYHALLISHGISEGALKIKQFFNFIPEYLNGFKEGFKTTVDSLKLEESIEKIEEAFNQLF